jgi:HK97 family phage prohead protease
MATTIQNADGSFTITAEPGENINAHRALDLIAGKHLDRAKEHSRKLRVAELEGRRDASLAAAARESLEAAKAWNDAKLKISGSISEGGRREVRSAVAEGIPAAGQEHIGRKLHGYAVVFYDAADPGTEFRLGEGIVERVDSRAFDKTLLQSNDITAYFNHDPNLLLGRTFAKTLRVGQDSRGVFYMLQLDPESPTHQNVRAAVKRGDLAGGSFTFTLDRQRFIPATSKTPIIRILEDVNLIELGPVTTPAYKATTAEIH